MKQSIYLVVLSLVLIACKGKEQEHDASGTFEATEVIISSEAEGKLELFKVEEGDFLKQNQYIGYVDTLQLYLKKRQLQSSGKSIQAQRPDVSAQIAATKEQIAKAEFERNRIRRLLSENAATQKQLDDANSQIQVLQKNLNAQISTLSTSINTLNEQTQTTSVQVMQVEDQVNKSKIINPVEGTVLSKYIEEQEMLTKGKPLYKIADTRKLFLRAYLVSNQLSQIKLGQKVTVYINDVGDSQKSYPGRITWISNKAEFTPKTVQTQDERQNLVYAIKIEVPNTDGMIKIGMYGDVNFK